MYGAFGPRCGLCICSWLHVLTALVPPAWWQKGWARQRVGSVAEAELLSQLAVLLMPDEAIEEMFRRFPSPEGWGGNYLEPDLAAYGVLKDENAALFVEYDGYWRHGEKEGVHRDRKKNRALLAYAPRRSCVIRLGHTKSTQLDDGVLWIQVDSWRRGDGKSLANAVLNIVVQLIQVLGPRPFSGSETVLAAGRSCSPSVIGQRACLHSTIHSCGRLQYVGANHKFLAFRRVLCRSRRQSLGSSDPWRSFH